MVVSGDDDFYSKTLFIPTKEIPQTGFNSRSAGSSLFPTSQNACSFKGGERREYKIKKSPGAQRHAEATRHPPMGRRAAPLQSLPLRILKTLRQDFSVPTPPGARPVRCSTRTKRRFSHPAAGQNTAGAKPHRQGRKKQPDGQLRPENRICGRKRLLPRFGRFCHPGIPISI